MLFKKKRGERGQEEARKLKSSCLQMYTFDNCGWLFSLLNI